MGTVYSLRRLGDALQTQERQDRTRPILLLSDRLETYQSAQRLMFEGLTIHYMECLLSGRLDVWATAAKAAIDLCAAVPESPERTK